jgi:acyl carrier protein
MHATSAVENDSLNVGQHLPSANITKSTKFVAGLERLDQHALMQPVESMVQMKVHEVVSGTNASADDPLMESGLDSLAATELLNSIQQELGHAAKLPSTVAFDYPTVKELAAHIMSALQPRQGARSTHLTQKAVLDMVLSKVHAVVSGTSVSADDPLMESGVDSLATTELQNSLQQELGTAVKLPSTMAFDSPTAAEIAQFISHQLLPQTALGIVQSHKLTAPLLNSNHLHVCEQSRNQLGVNIVAAQGKTPADLCHSSSAWLSLSCARDSIAKIPAHRFEQSATHDAVYGHFVNGHHTPESVEDPHVSALLGVQVLNCSTRSCST